MGERIMQRFKVTTSWTTYSHYIVDAVNVDVAENKIHEGSFISCKDDPSYGDNDEEILSVTSIKIEDTQ